MNDFGFGALAKVTAVLAVLAPLAVWKIAEIIWWLATHVRVTW